MVRKSKPRRVWLEWFELFKHPKRRKIEASHPTCILKKLLSHGRVAPWVGASCHTLERGLVHQDRGFDPLQGTYLGCGVQSWGGAGRGRDTD